MLPLGIGEIRKPQGHLDEYVSAKVLTLGADDKIARHAVQ